MIRYEFVKRKLHLIAEDLIRLIQFKDATVEDIAGDFVKLAAVERMLERIVIRAIDINAHLISETATGREEKSTRLTYRDTFLKLVDLKVYPPDFGKEISKSAGLRNILIHDYNGVDSRIVHASIRSCLKDYQCYIDYVSDFLAAIERTKDDEQLNDNVP